MSEPNRERIERINLIIGGVACYLSIAAMIAIEHTRGSTALKDAPISEWPLSIAFLVATIPLSWYGARWLLDAWDIDIESNGGETA